MCVCTCDHLLPKNNFAKTRRVYACLCVCVSCPPPLPAAALTGFRAASKAIDKYVFLRKLQATDANSFYRLLMTNSMEIMPYVYTPTVGEAGGDGDGMGQGGG